MTVTPVPRDAGARGRRAGTHLGAAPLPGAGRTGLAMGRLEVRAFFRERQAVVFVFALPVVLLVLLGSIFGDQVTKYGVSVGAVFAAGMIAGGAAAASFENLGLNIAAERDRGVLKRLRGTPMAPAAYFIGKIVLVLVCVVAEVAVLMAVSVAFYHLHLPSSADRWWTLAWVLGLGTVACSLAGIAISSLPRSRTNAGPVIMLPFVVLQFISGVYVPFNDVPSWLQHIAALFPLKWMSQGLRSVFLPSAAVTLEPAHSWQLGYVALVLTAWIAGGLLLCLKTFRWLPSHER
jgi:ABC-2 type transport system permease protein